MRSVAGLVLSSFCLLSIAQAEEASSGGGYLPKEHDFEVMLEAPPIINTWSPSAFPTLGRGLGLLAGNQTTVGFGLNGGFGYCITDLIEVGGAAAIDIVSAGGGTAFTFGVAPMVKFNLGHQLAMGSRINPFVQTGISFGIQSVSNGPTGALFVFEAEPGVEFMLTPRWGLNVFMPLGVVYSGLANQAYFMFGVQYGMIGYF